MRCPNCGAKFPKNANVCLHCGTEMNQLVRASKKDVSKAKKEYQPELIVYSSIFPSDLSYKNTLLLCIFLGLFGAHRYYTKQYISAILMTVFWSITLIFSAILGLFWGGYLTLNMDLYLFESITSFVSIGGVVVLIRWIYDIVLLALKKYKVPVILGKKN